MDKTEHNTIRWFVGAAENGEPDGTIVGHVMETTDKEVENSTVVLDLMSGVLQDNGRVAFRAIFFGGTNGEDYEGVLELLEEDANRIMELFLKTLGKYMDSKAAGEEPRDNVVNLAAYLKDQGKTVH